MKIAVMSDSHDNIWNLRKALDVVEKEKVEMIIHCGDFIAPFMLKELDQAGVPVHGVFGNNDGDRYLLTRFSLTTLNNITLYDPVGQVGIDGFTIAFTHHGMVGEGLASQGIFHMVCYGHSHEYSYRKEKKTALLNPGEIMGKDGEPGFCLVDTATLEVKRVNIRLDF